MNDMNSAQQSIVSIGRLCNLNQTSVLIDQEEMIPTARAQMEGIVWTSDPTVELPIRISNDDSNPACQRPMTMMQVMDNTVEKCGNNPAVRVKRGGVWRTWTYNEYRQECRTFAKALLAHGLERFDRVAIIGFNSPEWFFSDLGTIFAGGIAAGIYTTNGTESCQYIASHSAAKFVVAENELQMRKFWSQRSDLPRLTTIIQYTGPIPTDVIRDQSNSHINVMTWEQFMSDAVHVSNETLDQRIQEQVPGHCCTLIYTSGTTGFPKAVMLSHDNITWTASTGSQLLDVGPGDATVSYLPLSHIAAQMTDIHGAVLTGICVSCAQPDALKGSLIDTLKEVRPHGMLGVPRVWEKMEEGIKAVGASSGLKKVIADWAKRIGTAANKACFEGGSAVDRDNAPVGYTLANTIIFNTIRKALGLDRCRTQASGAAPISIATLKYFVSLNIPIVEIYGMSECSGPHTANTRDATKFGTVGRPIPGVEVRLDQSAGPGQEGEVCMRGRNVFMGYMFNRKATTEAIDENGWLHSGDLGVVDQDGFLRITGRIKELIVTAGGENVPPVLIEDAIKTEIPALANVMVIGDQRKYLVALFTIKSEVDEDGNPIDSMSAPALEFARSAGSKARTVSQASQCPQFCEALQAGLDIVNSRATSNAQKVQKFAVVPVDFSVTGGELTPTLKLKRRVVHEKYADLIDRMYDGTTSSSRIQARL